MGRGINLKKLLGLWGEGKMGKGEEKITNYKIQTNSKLQCPKLQTKHCPTGILERRSDGKHIVYTNWKRWECRSGVDKGMKTRVLKVLIHFFTRNLI